MNRDKKLYTFMIKNHPTIVGWFIHKGIVGKNENRLYLVENNNKDEIIDPILPNINDYQVYETYNDGVVRIHTSIWSENFSEIRLNDNIEGVSFKTLVDAGFHIFEINYSKERYCFTHQIEEIINNFPDLVLSIEFPNNYKKRMKGMTLENYMKIQQTLVDYIKNNKNLFNFNIYRHGLFAFKETYKYIEWNFDMVEKYKDQIMWKDLINESNLIWSDKMLEKYIEYIPFCDFEENTYCGRFKNELDYTKFGFLGNEFLYSHKDILDWRKIFEKCKFEWTDKEMKYFSEYAFGIDLPYFDSYHPPTTSSQLIWSQSELIDNKHFKWTPSNLLAYLLSNSINWEWLISKYRPEIFRTFLSIPNIKEIAEPYVKDINDFWEIVCNPHPFPYDKLSPYFTIESVQLNREVWSSVIDNKFLTMRRTPDTNYHYYLVITQWDEYRNRNNIPLTYALAKYLSTIDIKIGGSYVESDGGYIEEDHRFPVYNGLEAFSLHHIDTKQDLDNILEDENLANILLDYTHSINLDLLYYSIEKFFKDYPLNEYLIVINRLKDWDVVKVFYGNEEEDNSFNDKDWDRLMNSIMIYEEAK